MQYMMLSNHELIHLYWCVINILGIVYYIKRYIANLLIKLHKHIDISVNFEGFTIKTCNEIVILTSPLGWHCDDCKLSLIKIYENAHIYKYDFKHINAHKYDILNGQVVLENCVIKYVNKISILRTNYKRCVFILSRAGELFAPKYLTLGTIWSDDIALGREMVPFVKLNFHKNGIVTNFSCTMKACFVIVDTILYVTGIISGRIHFTPEPVIFSDDEFALSVECTNKHAIILTNKKNVYSVLTKQGLALNKINTSEKAIYMSSCAYDLYTLTENCIIIHYLNSSRNVVISLPEMLKNAIKICCVSHSAFYVMTTFPSYQKANALISEGECLLM